jgi:hypothetical protein
MDTLYIGRSEAEDLLNVGHRSIARLVDMGLIRKRVLPGHTYGQYAREDVERLVNHGVPQDPHIETKVRKLMEIQIDE